MKPSELMKLWEQYNPRMATKHIDHTEYPKMLKKKSIAELKFIIKDAREAMEAMPNNPNYGYYADEVNYAAMELNNRMKSQVKEAEEEILTKKLNNGATALAKNTKYGVYAYTFTNKSQAEAKIDAMGLDRKKWAVRAFGRPFYVIKTDEKNEMFKADKIFNPAPTMG